MNRQRHSPREEAKRPERLLRLPAVAARLGMSRSWIYDEIAAGRFPRPVKRLLHEALRTELLSDANTMVLDDTPRNLR